MKGKILLLSPPYRILKKRGSLFSKNVHRRAQPLLGIGSLATCLHERGFEVKYLDSAIEDINNTFSFDETTDCYGLSYEAIVERVRAFAPDVVGITCLSSGQFMETVRIAADIKKMDPTLPVVIGGNHASLNAREVMKHSCFDFVFKGEGEFLFSELVRTILEKRPMNQVPSIFYRDAGTVQETPGFERIKDLDTIPYFNWELVPLKRYWQEALPQNPFAKSRKSIPYETSRGCPEDCIFCSTARFFSKKFRPKSARRVVDEIRKTVTRYGVEEVEFMDDNIALDPKRFMEICDGLADLHLYLCAPSGIRLDYMKDDAKVKEVYEKMKKAGFYQITFAVESGNEYMLNHVIKKRLDLKRMERNILMAQEMGFKTHGFFIIGFPRETQEQMADTIRFAENLHMDSYSLSLATPFPGTELREWVERDNLFIRHYDESDLLLGRSLIKRSDDLSAEELEQLTAGYVDKLNRKEPIFHGNKSGLPKDQE